MPPPLRPVGGARPGQGVCNLVDHRVGGATFVVQRHEMARDGDLLVGVVAQSGAARRPVIGERPVLQALPPHEVHRVVPQVKQVHGITLTHGAGQPATHPQGAIAARILK